MQHWIHAGASPRRACVLAAAAVTLLCLSIVPAALAAPLQIIFDDTATPSFDISVAGSGAFADAAMAVTADSSGAYIAGERGNAAGNADASLVKVVGGAPAWVKWYDGPAHKADWAYKVVKRGNAVYTAGWRTNAVNKQDILLVKWSSVNGAVKWARVYDGPLHGNDAATALGIDANGNVTVAGFSQGAGGDDWVVVSWSPAGERRWAWRYAGSAGGADRPMDLVVDRSGRVYVTGWITVAGPKAKAMTLKFSPAGTKLWSKTTFGPGVAAAANGIVLRPAGGVYCVGRARDSVTGWDALVMRYSSGGDLTLLPSIGYAGDQDLFDVAVTSNGTVAAVGNTNDGPGSDSDIYRVWYAGNGTYLGGRSHGGPYDESATAVAADSFGGYYPVGYTRPSETQAMWAIWRIGSIDGNASWRSTAYLTDGINMPGPAALFGVYGNAVAAYGNKVYVVGERWTGGPSGMDQQVAVFMY